MGGKWSWRPKWLKHRWSRATIYGLVVTLTCCHYAGWQQYSLMLLKGGKYSWLCTDDVGAPIGSQFRINADGIRTCPDMERSVGDLFPIAVGAELVGAVFAGFALDHMGPLFAAMIGEFLGIIAALMLIFSSRTVNLLAASMTVTGVAINLIAFPSLILEDYFPSAAATTAAFVISCQCLSSIVAPVLWAMWRKNPQWTFQGIWGIFILIIWVPCSILYCLALPVKREIPQLTKSELRDIIDHADALPLNGKTEPLFQEESRLQTGTREDARTPEETRSNLDLEGVSKARIYEEVVVMQPAHHSLEEDIRELSADKLNKIEELSRTIRFKEFMRTCLSPEFIAMNVINIILMLQSSLYQVIVREYSGSSVADFVGWAMPVQAVTGLLLGRLADVIKTPIMMIFLSLGYLLTYSLILVPSARFVTACIFIITLSYAYTVKYTFVQETFPTAYYGRLVGIAGAVSGVSVLLTPVMTHTMTLTFWCYVLLASSILSCPIAGYLYVKARRTAKTFPETELLQELEKETVMTWTDVVGEVGDVYLALPR